MAATQIPKEWGTNKVSLHDECVKVLEIMVDVLKSTDIVEANAWIKEWRVNLDASFGALNKPRDYKGTIEDRQIPSPQVKGGIPARIYKPEVIQKDPAILLYFHGGGQVWGHFKFNASMSKCLTSSYGFIIVDVNYRLCPENPLPAGLEDCAVATQWVMDNKQQLGGSVRSPVGVSGDSAGGQAAIYVSHHVKGVDFQIPVYPWTDLTCKSPSIDEFANGPLIHKPVLFRNAAEITTAANRNAEDPRWSPVFHTDFTDVPPTLVVLAQLDAIRDDGRRYAKLLIDAGVPVMVYEVKGAIHGFYTSPDFCPELTKQAYSKVGSFIQWISQRKINS